MCVYVYLFYSDYEKMNEIRLNYFMKSVTFTKFGILGLIICFKCF